MAITITYAQLTLINMLIQAGISFFEARARVSKMTEEQVEAAIVSEEARNKLLNQRLDAH